MGRVLVAATAGAGGDLQPLLAAALALRRRGHETLFVADKSVRQPLHSVGIDMRVLPGEFDLGPRLMSAIREGMAVSGGDMSVAGRVVRERMAVWAAQTAGPVGDVMRESGADVVVTSLFGVEVLNAISPPCPWAVVNSTFYVGPNPPRPVDQDFGARAVPLMSRYASLLGSADLVLHATDPVFDFSFDGLPTHHRYVGPLGIWEPPSAPPAYLDQPGNPWVLVTISSQRQDDMPLAEAAMAALADHPVRVVVTVGPDHALEEVTVVPGNARLEQTVSHAAVLKRAALMVSHAGHGSVMKALWHGCPMVLVPWGRDQSGVAARAAALGVAEIIEREHAWPDAFAAAVDRALADGRLRDAAASHRARLSGTDPPATAASLLESLL